MFMGRKIILTIIILFVCLSVQSQNLPNDTLVFRYRHFAVEYQQQVKQALHGLKGAESQLKVAKGAMAPHLDFKSNYSYYGVPLKLAPKDGALTGEDLHNFYSMDMTLTQPVIQGGQLKNTRLMAEANIEAMQNLVNLNKQEVMLAADRYYLTAVAKKEIYSLTKAYRDVIGRFVNIIRDKVDEEIVGKNELFQAKVRYNDAEYQTIRSEKEFKISIMEMNRLMGFPLDSVPQIRDSLPEININIAGDNGIQKALSMRPEIGFLKSKIQINTYKEKLSVSKYNVHMGVLAGGKWGSPSPGLQIEPGFNYYLKANLIIPVFYWGERKNTLFAVKQETESVKLEMEKTSDNIRLEVRQSYFNLISSQKQMNFAADALTNAQKNVEVMLDRYNEGLSSVLEVLDAQTYWQKSYFNYIQAKYELNLAYSRYQRALGTLTDTY